MEFTPRIRDILKILLESDHPVTKQEVADRIGVSKRTVQREFEYLEPSLEEYGLKLENKKGVGLWITGEEEKLAALREDVAGGKVVGAEAKEDRSQRILFSLLKDPTPKKLYYFSDMLGVSEATAASDMEQLRPWLEKNHLKLVKRPGYGVAVEGEEKDLRRAMRRFISEFGGAELFRDHANRAISEAMVNSIHGNSIYSLLQKDTVDRVRRVLESMEEPGLWTLADNAYMGLVIHIAIAVERIQSGGILSASTNKDLESMKGMEEYALAQRILTEMEEEFEIDIPETEISFLMLHLLGSKMAYTSEGQDLLKETPGINPTKMMDVIDAMITAYDPLLAGQLSADEDFLNGLIMHLRPVLIRLKNGMDIYNPVLDDIKAEYPQVFEKSRRAAAVLGEAVNTSVSDEEIGFLAMHFGAAEERLQSQGKTTRRVDIGVVCSSGFGLAKLMIARLQEHLGDKANFISYGRGDISPYTISRTDFFVSTFDLTSEGVDFVHVSPLINQGDLAQIETKMGEYAYLRLREDNTSFAKQLDAANFATREIKGLIQRHHHFKVDPNITFDQLLWFFAMKSASNTVDAKTIMRDLKHREEVGSQVFSEFGLILLHSKTAGIKEATFLSCTPETGDTAEVSEKAGALDQSGIPGFANPYLKGVKLAILLLMPDDEYSKEHSDVLGYISASFVKDKNLLPTFVKGDEAEISEAVVKLLRQYFYELLERI